MEQSKVSLYQFFILIMMFELGTALLFPIATDAKQDAWLAILISMVGGFAIFLMYYAFYYYYPDDLPTTYLQKITGKFIGRILGFIYCSYFLYLTARVMRDFGEMLSIIGYPNTPILVNHTLMMIVIIYTVRKGIEVLARAAEMFFILIYVLAISGFVLILFSQLIDPSHLKPILKDGLFPVVKVALTQTLYFPFGEIFAFSMILPYINKRKGAIKIGLLAIALSGINLAISSAINISVLGVSEVARSPFPLLGAIQAIQIAGFLERLDIFFMIALVILGFFKGSLFFYVSVIGLADVFKINEPSKLAFPLGFVVLFFSVVIASNMTEHMREGVRVLSLTYQLPFQILLPFLLLVIAFFKNRWKKG